MDKLSWCKKKGLRFIQPNEIIANDYFRKADDSLQVISKVESKEWKTISAYYACYDALYSLLQKAGINSEIHDCTIELMSFFQFNSEDIEFLKNLKIQRENAQYYVDRDFLLPDIDKIKGFVLKCKQKSEELDFDKIKKSLL